MNLPIQSYTRDLRKYYRLPSVQVSLTLVLSIFVIAVFITFALRPTIVSIVTLKKTIVESEKVLQQLDTKVKNIQLAATQLESVKQFLPNIDVDIPSQGAMYYPLTRAVENLANQNGITLDSETLGSTLLFSRILSPFAPSKNQSVIILPFSVRVTGSYQNISAFLTKLLSMERIIMVDSIGITKETNSKGVEPSVALNVAGSAYYLADQLQLEKTISDSTGGK